MKTLLMLFTLLWLTGSLVVAQNKDSQKADELFEKLQYVDAIKSYQKLLKEGKGNRYVYEKLADSYFAINDTKKSETYYRRVVKGKNPRPESIYNFAQSLKTNEKYNEYSIWMKRYAEIAPTDSRSVVFMQNPEYLPQLLKTVPDFTLTNLEDINTEFSEFGGTITANSFYFSSARNIKRKTSGVDGQAYLDIYKAQIIDDIPKDPDLLNTGDINTKYHEANVAISPNGKRLFFDRNDYYKGDYNKGDNGVSQINLYYATLVDGRWQDVQPVPFNDQNYSTGHPALSPNGNTLYFVSDKPGGSGKSDLYMVSIDKNGDFGSPQRLDNSINTEGKEVFPFMDANGTLYFSSDGHLGVGGLDVFYTEATGQAFGAVQNLGPVINSPKDDFAFKYDTTTGTGYLSSNRKGGKGSDDIYLTKKNITTCEAEMMITVVNAATKNPISNAEVTIYDNKENKLSSKNTEGKGDVFFIASCNETYAIQVSAVDFESNSISIENVSKGKSERTIELWPIDKLIVDNKVVLNPIYFDLDKSNITPKAAFELDKLVSLMKKYPTMVIKAESHTDNRGDENYNLKLSERRAQSTVQYVISQGIASERISGQGYGESNPIVNCDTNCTTAQHQQNRRSEFIIVKR